MISVLYVDDEPGLLEIGRIFLEADGGFTVAISPSAGKALELLSTRSYDAIISDYLMPEINGIKFLKEVRKRFDDIPFILFTGRGREEIVIDAINNGADFYLQKGGDPKSQFAELAHKIRQAVRRRETERELRQSEARYRSVVNDQTEMIVRFTTDGTITFTNEAYRSYFVPMLGLHEIAGKNIRDLMQIGNYEVVENFLGSLTPETPIREMERNVTGSDGETYWQLWSVRALFDKTGKTKEYQVVGKDITEQKRSSAALADSESRLRSFIETTREAVTLIDEKGMVVEWNAATEEISGIKKDEALGRPIWDLTFRMLPREQRTEDRRVAIRKALHTMLQTGEPPFDGPRVVEAERPDGTHVFTRQVMFPIRTGKGFRFGSISQDVTREILSEDVVRESEARYRELADLLPQMVFELDLDFRVSWANQHALANLGFTVQEIDHGINALSFIVPSDAITAKEDAMKFLSGMPLEAREFTAVRKDKSSFPVLVYSAPVFRNEKLCGFRGVAADISDRKKMEDSLRESEEKFRGMAERSSDLIFVLDRQMSPTYVSPSARSIIGYDPDELVGKPPEFAAATIFSRAGPALMNAVGSTMKGLPVDNVELQLTRKDGSPVYASLHAVPVVRDGALEGAQVTMRDITDRRLAETALRESEEKYRSFVENANEIVFSLNPEGIFSYVSPKWTDVLGHDTGEVIGKPAAAFIHPEDYPRNRTVFIQAVTEGKKTSGLEYRIQHKNGTWAWHSQSISPVYDAGGRIVAVQGICHDVSERRKAEDALRQANKKLNLLSSITRHDISNQLLVLNGFIGLLQTNICDPSYHEYFSRIMKASSQIAAMIRFTKEYEKIGSGAPVWRDLTVSLSSAESGIIPGQIAIRNDLPDGIEVLADPMLERVFFNLLDNAVRHGEGVTEIHVSSRLFGEDLVVVWEDNGIGIDASEKERIFEWGFGKNTGLGMFLVREILSLTGIAIAETGILGKGARFEITVPHGSWRVLSRFE